MFAKVFVTPQTGRYLRWSNKNLNLALCKFVENACLHNDANHTTQNVCPRKRFFSIIVLNLMKFCRYKVYFPDNWYRSRRQQWNC